MDGLIIKGLLAHCPFDLSTTHVCEKGLVDYETTLQQMQDFTACRTPETQNEIWLCEHPSVFTLGKFGQHEHILDPGNIPVVQTDRGGQVTYHGPGQLMVYLLFDLHIGPKKFVAQIETWVINWLASLNVKANTECGKPGVYVNDAKICAIGLKLKKRRTYHGLAINIDMDLSPFKQINPCGYADQAVTNLSDNVDIAQL